MAALTLSQSVLHQNNQSISVELVDAILFMLSMSMFGVLAFSTVIFRSW